MRGVVIVWWHVIVKIVVYVKLLSALMLVVIRGVMRERHAILGRVISVMAAGWRWAAGKVPLTSGRRITVVIVLLITELIIVVTRAVHAAVAGVVASHRGLRWRHRTAFPKLTAVVWCTILALPVIELVIWVVVACVDLLVVLTRLAVGSKFTMFSHSKGNLVPSWIDRGKLRVERKK
jgi:hypothetical protein